MNNINPKGVIKMAGVHSRLSVRMKAVSISLLMVFFSQQVSWACAGNFSLLVNLPPSPLIYQDHGEFNRLVANRVYSLAKPSFRHKPQELKSVYQWLKQPSTQTVPCSAYVLYNLLQANGIKPKIEDISASLISLDLKAGNLKPPFTASRIDNSLYALAKTAENQGLHLYPARLNSITPELLNSLNSQTPFIAHLNYSEALDKGHFVLVTGIDADKVHFFYDKGNTFLPLEKFIEEFSGYCLISAAVVVAAQCAATTVSDAEAKAVLGAKSYKGVRVDYTKLFKEPSTKDLLIGFGVSVGTMFGGSMLSGMMNGQGLSFGKAFAGLGAGIAQAEISKASVNFSVQQFKMKPLYAQIVGYGVSGAMSGAIGGIGNKTNFTFKGVNFFSNFMNDHSIFRGATMGFVQGGMQGTGSVLAYQGIKNTSFYQKNPFIARQVAELVGGAVGYMGFYAMTGAMRMNVNIDKNNSKVFGVDQQKGVSQITYSDGSMHYRISSDGMTGGAGVFNNVKLALADSSFLSSMISQGTALGVEWAAGPKYAKYSRILGQGIGSAAGGLATGNGISPWKMMMNGALSGGISLGLGYLGGEVGPDGKNKLGLTDIQMAGVEWLGTATLYSGIGAAMSKTPGTTFADAFGQRFGEFSTDYVSFGRTSPLYTKGAGGWSSFMYNQKIADFGGFANYKANADYSMKLQGYKSWSKFVDDGKAANLLPSFSNSLVRYASTSLHYGAVSNAIATVGWFPKSVTNFLGIEKHRVNNENMASLEKKLDAAKKEMDQDKIQTIEALLTEIKSSNSNGNDRWHSWIVVSQPNSLSESGYSFFTLGGSRIGFNEKGKLDFLLTHLRKPMEGQVKVGSKYYNLGEGYTKEYMAALSKEGAKAIPIIESNKKPGEAAFVNLANLLFYAQDDGYLSVGLKRTLNNDNGEFIVGRVSTKHEKGKPTITDIFTAHQVTPKKFWFDKKTPINTGIALAVYNRQIETNEGLKYLGKNKPGLYPAAGFGYSQSGIVTKDGDNVRRSKDEMVVELSVLGQGVERKTKEDIMSVVEPEKTVKDETPVVAPVSTEQKVEGEAKDVEKTKFTGADIMKRFRLDQKDGGVVFYFGDMKAGDIPGLTFQFNKDKGNYDAILNNEKIAEVDGVEDMIAPGKYRFRWHGNPTTYRDESWDTESKAEKTGNKAMIPKKEEISKAAEASLASKDETPVSKGATSGQTGPVKIGERIITTTTTPKITTTITIDEESLRDLYSRDNQQSSPFTVGKSEFGVTKPQSEGLPKEFDRPFQSGYYDPGASEQKTINPQQLPEEMGQRMRYLEEIEKSHLGEEIPPPKSNILKDDDETVEPNFDWKLVDHTYEVGKIGGNGKGDVLGGALIGGADFYNSDDFKAYDGKEHPVDLFLKSGKPNEEKYDILYGVNYNENNENKTDLWYRPRSEIKQEKQNDLTEYLSKMEASGKSNVPDIQKDDFQLGVKNNNGSKEMASVPGLGIKYDKAVEGIADDLEYVRSIFGKDFSAGGSSIDANPVAVIPIDLGSSTPAEGELNKDYLKDLRDIHEKAGKYVDSMSENEGTFGSVPVDIKIPPHLLHNIGDQLTYKNKEDLVREIEFYNIKSLPPKSPVDSTMDDEVKSPVNGGRIKRLGGGISPKDFKSGVSLLPDRVYPDPREEDVRYFPPTPENQRNDYFKEIIREKMREREKINLEAVKITDELYDESNPTEHRNNMEKMGELGQDLDKKYQDFYWLKDRKDGMPAAEANKARRERVLKEEVYKLEAQLSQKEGLGEKVLNFVGARIPNEAKENERKIFKKGLIDLQEISKQGKDIKKLIIEQEDNISKLQSDIEDGNKWGGWKGWAKEKMGITVPLADKLSALQFHNKGLIKLQQDLSKLPQSKN